MKRHIEVILWAFALLLPLLANFGSSRLYLGLIAVVWLAATSTVVPLHFYRAWKKWESVPNRKEYAAWVGFETLATCGFIGLCLYGLFSN